MSATIDALGWALVHFLWQGCLIAVLFWVVCAFTREGSPHLRYWSGISAYVVALGAFAATFRFYYQPAAEFTPVPLSAEPVNSFLVMSGSAPDLWSWLQAGIEPSLPAVVVCWFIGAFLMSARGVAGWMGARKLLQHGTATVEPDLQRLLDELIGRLSIRQAVQVFESSLARVPMVIGWFRPVILLPISVLAGMPRDQLEMVIAHELGHIKRLDYLVNLFQIVVETMLFYHPAIRWMARRIRQEREHCCDDLVVRRCGRRVVYAKALANLEVLRAPAALTAMAASGGDLLSRVRRIVTLELPRSGAGYAQLSILALVATIVALSAQQGLSVQRALNDIAATTHLQISDIEIKTWNQSRAAWAEGVGRFARESALTVAELRTTPSSASRSETRPERELKLIVADANFPLAAAESSQPRAENPAAAALVRSEIPAPDGKAVSDEIAANLLRTAVQPPYLIDLPDEASEKGSPGRVDLASASGGKAEKPIAATQPRVTRSVRPRYPWRARRDGQEGFVKLSFALNEKGRAKEIEIVDAYPEQVFDKSAIKAIKKWKFERAENWDDDQRMTQTFDFELSETDKSATKRRYCGVTGSRTCSFGLRNADIVYVNPPNFKHLIIEH